MGRTDAYMVSQIEAQLGRPLPANWEEPFQHLYREAFEAELTCSTICGSSHDFFGAIPIFNIATIPLSDKLLTPVNWTDTYERAREAIDDDRGPSDAGAAELARRHDLPAAPVAEG